MAVLQSPVCVRLFFFCRSPPLRCKNSKNNVNVLSFLSSAASGDFSGRLGATATVAVRARIYAVWRPARRLANDFGARFPAPGAGSADANAAADSRHGVYRLQGWFLN